MSVQGGPHEFKPLRRWFNRGRCQHCYWPEREHPRLGWSTARPLGDKSGPMRVEDSQKQPDDDIPFGEES